MASRKIRDEVMMMTISVNSDPAQHAIYELRKENVAFSESIEEMTKKREALGKRTKANAAEYDDLTAQIKKNGEAIRVNKDRMEDLRRAMDVNHMTMNQLAREASFVKQQLKEMVPGANLEAQRNLEERLKAVNERMAEIDINAREGSRGLAALADKFNNYSGLVMAGAAAIAAVGMAIQNIIDRNNKMADAYAGVSKNVGMTTKEVEELSRSFAEFDTRTKKIDLLKMAESGGKLGVPKEQIQDFVRATDIAFVALGDSWEGGANKIAEEIGKVINLYSETKNMNIGDAINDVGSALNELASDGAASEQNITEFLQRMGRTPEALRPGIKELLGYGAAFEEFGIDAEIGSSGFSKFLRVAANSTDKFSQVMNVPVEKIKEMINNDPGEFFLKFSEGLKGMDPDKMAAVLDFLKLNDAEVVGVIGAASENTERFRQQVVLASKAMEEGTSLQAEFDKVNNNAAATWEKLTKKVSGFFTSEFVAKGLDFLVRSFALFIGVGGKAEEELGAFERTALAVTRVLAILFAAIIGGNAVIALYNLLLKDSIVKEIALTTVQKTKAATMNMVNGATTLYNLLLGASGLLLGRAIAATGALTGATALQTAGINMAAGAQMRLNVAMASNPIGAVITALTAVVAIYMAYKAASDSTAAATDDMNDAMKRSAEIAATDTQFLNENYNAATNHKLSLEERKKAVQKLQDRFPSYFGQLSQEIIMNGKAANSYYALRDAILASARAQALKETIVEREKKFMQEEEQHNQNRAEWEKNINNLKENNGKGNWLQRNFLNNFTGAIKDHERMMQQDDHSWKQRSEQFQKEQQAYVDRMKAEEERAKVYNGDKTKLDATVPTSGYSVPDDDKKDKPKKDKHGKTPEQRAAEEAARVREQREKDHEKDLELERWIENELLNARIEGMENGLEKELAMMQLARQRREAEIDKKMHTDYDFEVLDKQINEAKGEDRQFFIAMKSSWLKNNAELEDLKNQERASGALKEKVIREKYQNEEIKDEEEQHQRELAQLKREENEKLASYGSLQEMKADLAELYDAKEVEKIKTWEEGKAILRKVYQKKELELQETHLQAMIKQFEGLDMSILTKEQHETIMKMLDEAKNKLAEVGAAKKDIAANESEKSALKGGLSGGTDILGLSVQDWEDMFTNTDTFKDKVQQITLAIRAVQNAFGEYYKYVQANEQRQMREVEVNAKRKEFRLKQLLDSGMINQEQYEKRMQDVARETEMEKYRLELDAAKRQKAMNAANIIASTAMAIMNIWATSNPITAAILTTVVGGLGALQLATVLAQPLPEAPGFEAGFGMDYDIRRQQDGKRFNVRREKLKSGPVYRPTHFIAGEAGLEYVIDTDTYAGFSPALKSALHNEVAYSRGYQGGYYPYLEDRPLNKPTPTPEDNPLAAVVENNTAALQKVAGMRPVAVLEKSMDTAKHIIDLTEEYNSYQNSAKK